MNDANLSSNGLTLTEKGGTFFAFNNVFVGFFSRLSETLDVNALNKVAKNLCAYLRKLIRPRSLVIKFDAPYCQ